MPVLTTDRLELDHLNFEDAPFILELLNDEDFIEHIGDKNVRTLAEARDYLQTGPMKSYKEHGFGLYRVKENGSKASIGICGLLKRDVLDDVDIGYAFLPDFRGKGFATESCEAMMAYARDNFGIERIVAVVSPGNEKSQRVLMKLGLQFEKMIRLAADTPESMLFSPRKKAGAFE